MRVKKAQIDSINLSANHLEAIFLHHEDYRLQSIKDKHGLDNASWYKTFGKSLKQHIIEAKIIHTHRGMVLPLKIFASSPLRQTVEFAGLHGYNERSKQLMITFNELKSQLQYTRVMRIDVAIDYEGEIPKRIIKALYKYRKPFEWKNTTYYKTAKELENKDKSNPYMDIKTYDKAKKEKLDYSLNRLEFVFKSKYFKDLHLKDIDQAIKKMEKSIKKATELSVKIKSI